MSRTRGWCFTINNYGDDDIAKLDSLTLDPKVVYLVYGKEVGEEKATPHLQGYLHLDVSTRFNAVKRLLPDACHLEPRRGTVDQAIDYCMKDEDYVEHGKRPRQGKRNDLVEIKARLDNGDSEETIADNHFGSWVRYRKSFAAYSALKKKGRCFERSVFWIYGATGTGKSKYCATIPNAYWKPPGMWFDGYDGEENVVIDELRNDHFSFAYALRLFDRYPLQVPIKGSFRPWLAKNIFITAPCPPGDLWATSENMAQLLRRLTIVEFPGQACLLPPQPQIMENSMTNPTDVTQ